MTNQHLLVAVLAAAAVFGADGGANSVLISGSFSGGPIPRYGHGRMVSYGSDGLTVTAFRADGLVAFSQVLKLPEAAANRISDVAMAGDGQVAAAASAQNRDGRSTPVIAWFGADGSLNRVVRSSPFAVYKLCFANDGTLWAIGRVYDEHFQTVPGHDVVRRYDAGGKLMQSMLSLRDLPALRGPHAGQGSLMIARGDGVSVLLPEVGVWIDLGAGGEIQRRIEGPLPAGGKVTGIGLLRDGSAVVQAILDQPRRNERVAMFRHRASTNRWDELRLEDSLEQTLLLGSDTARGLMFWDKRKSAMVWSWPE